MKVSTYIANLLVASLSVVIAHAEPDLTHEHPGSLFRKFHGRQDCGSSILHDGNSSGTTGTFGSGKYQQFIVSVY